MSRHIRISNTARAGMRKLGLGPMHRELISTLLEYEPVCTAGQRKLADLVGVSVRTLQRSLADLSQGGLRIIRGGGVKTTKGATDAIHIRDFAILLGIAGGGSAEDEISTYTQSGKSTTAQRSDHSSQAEMSDAEYLAACDIGQDHYADDPADVWDRPDLDAAFTASDSLLEAQASPVSDLDRDQAPCPTSENINEPEDDLDDLWDGEDRPEWMDRPEYPEHGTLEDLDGEGLDADRADIIDLARARKERAQ